MSLLLHGNAHCHIIFKVAIIDNCLLFLSDSGRHHRKKLCNDSVGIRCASKIARHLFKPYLQLLLFIHLSLFLTLILNNLDFISVIIDLPANNLSDIDLHVRLGFQECLLHEDLLIIRHLHLLSAYCVRLPAYLRR